MKNLNNLRSAFAFLSLWSLLSFVLHPNDETYKVDLQKSILTWTGKKFTGEHTGTVPISHGELILKNNVLKEGNFEFDLSGIVDNDITNKESNAKLIAHLKSDDFFQVGKYPTAHFVISSVVAKTAEEHLIKGKLTIKDITNDIEFPAIIKREGNAIKASAKIIVDRTKYNIKFKSNTFFPNLGDNFIYDEFELDLNLSATSLQSN